MKTKPRILAPVSQSRRAVALLIVLAILLLMSALLVAFMGTVSNEREAARSMASGFEAKQAYETAVNLAISQIREATKNDDGTIGWASQPGAIQTFGTGANANIIYKLYSARLMQQPRDDWKPETDTDESGFKSGSPNDTPEGMVDLNSPVYVPTTTQGVVEPHYPIADPRAGLNVDGGPEDLPGKKPRIIEGFYSANITHPNLTEKRGTGTLPVLQLPMRVRWLYQLKDGSIVAPDQSGILKNASKENPPVARLAFWTDDESSKINVNTAGEGTYWDIPLASSYKESGQIDNTGKLVAGQSNAFSASQPVNKEYQRYAGHPATTCLSPALRWLFSTPYDPIDNDKSFKEAIYRLAPRLVGGTGTSLEGTNSGEPAADYRVYERDRLFATLDEYWFRPDRSPLTDFGFYSVFREESIAYVPGKNFITDKVKFPPSALEKMRFFLTAVSRASDLNLWGKPRVSIWPVHEKDEPDPKSSKRSGFDDLMVFCSTIATKPYIFSRAQPWSTTYDYETSGVQTRVGASLNKNQSRNRDLMTYLRGLTDLPVPATGTTFTGSAGKYGTAGPGGFIEMDQIFLEMFDYIRSTNIVETGRKDNSATGYPLAYTLGYEPSGDLIGNRKPNPGSGQVTPIVRGTGKEAIKGFGRYNTLSEAALMFYSDTTSLSVGGSNEANAPDPKDYHSFRCALLTEFFTVSPGYLGLSEGFAYRVSEKEPFMISSVDDKFKQPLSLAENRTGGGNINFVGVDAWRSDSGRFFMPTRGFCNTLLYDDGIYKAGDQSDPHLKIFSKPNANNAGTEVEYSKYPFFSNRIDMPKVNSVTPTHFKLSKGTLVIEIFPLEIGKDYPNSSSITELANPPVYAKANLNEPIQTITITFPEVTLPTPKPRPNTNPFQVRYPSEIRHEKATGAPDNNKLRGTTYATEVIYDQYDVIRSMEINGLANGDNRLAAALVNPPENYYAPSGASNDYFNSNLYLVHNLRSGWGSDYPEGRKYYGTLTANAAVRWHKNNIGGPGAGPGGIGIKMPDVPKSINGVRSVDGTASGDFDRGFSKQVDGPFINKPDEGNTRNDPTDDLAGGGGLAYFRGDSGTEVVGKNFFAPNRMVSSPVMFGSLPTGIFSKRPWETLLFCPPVAVDHKGARSPADHYLLDLFTMPIVEPFAISEPLSSMGKINLNARLAPFGYAKDKTGRSYIERNTGLYAVLKGIKQFVAANDTRESGHAERPLTGSTSGVEFRFNIDPALTVDKCITPRFDAPDKKFFRSASEICEIDLLLTPKQESEPGKPVTFDDPKNRKTFWAANQMTGDNARERPYSLIYPRLTTKSNVYTVHVWSQSLAKNPNSTSDDWKKFDENRDKITGEYRGSTTIERFLDANDPALVPPPPSAPYDAVDAKSKGLDPYYRFRILNSKRFTMQ